MYVGFFVARLATIDIRNIQLTVTSAATDSPKVEPPSAPVEPSLNILSLSKTSEPDYQMIIRPNVDGTVTLKGVKMIDSLPLLSWPVKPLFVLESVKW